MPLAIVHSRAQISTDAPPVTVEMHLVNDASRKDRI